LDRVDQRLGAFAIDRGDREHRAVVAGGLLVGGQEIVDALLAIFLGNQVELVQHQPARFFDQHRVVLGEFADDRLGVADRIGIRVDRRDVDEVQQQAGALQVLQEADAEAGAVGGAFDQAGHVGDDEALFGPDADDAEVRVQRRERVVGTFGRAAEMARDQRAFPAFGRPSRPTSASTRSSSASSNSSPGSPLVHWRGARLVEDLKWMLPGHPCRPWHQYLLVVLGEVGQHFAGVQVVTTVPTGMRSTMSSPPAPQQSALPPFSPRWPRNLRV
jgi:hypothetical protein